MSFIINNFFYNWPCIQKRAGVALGHALDGRVERIARRAPITEDDPEELGGQGEEPRHGCRRRRPLGCGELLENEDLPPRLVREAAP